MEGSPTRRVSSLIGIALSAYMAYATLFGPYKTTIVHLALFLMAMLVVYFLRHEAAGEKRAVARRAFDWIMAGLSVAALLHVVLDWERLVALWGAPFLTRTDLVAGGVLVLVVLEAARRESFPFFVLSAIGILYILYGNLVPGVLGHPGMEIDRFIYLTAYTSEGVFDATSNILPKGAGILQQLAAAKPIDLVPIPDRVFDRLNKMFAGTLARSIVKANTYPGQTADVPSFSIPAVLITNERSDPALIYAFVRAYWENIGALVKFDRTLGDVSLELAAATVSRAATPLHPGAARYFREKGLLR